MKDLIQGRRLHMWLRRAAAAAQRPLPAELPRASQRAGRRPRADLGLSRIQGLLAQNTFR